MDQQWLNFDKQTMMENHLHDQHQFAYAIQEETVVGYIEYKATESELYIEWVVSNGKQRGLGRMLMMHVLECYPEVDVVLGVCACPRDPPWLLGARLNLYSSLGFRVTRWDPIDAYEDQPWECHIGMRLDRFNHNIA